MLWGEILPGRSPTPPDVFLYSSCTYSSCTCSSRFLGSPVISTPHAPLQASIPWLFPSLGVSDDALRLLVVSTNGWIPGYRSKAWQCTRIQKASHTKGACFYLFYVCGLTSYPQKIIDTTSTNQSNGLSLYTQIYLQKSFLLQIMLYFVHHHLFISASSPHEGW